MAQPLTPLTFDLDAFTQTIGPKVDLSRFEKSTPLAPGTYRVDVYINGYSTGRWDIDFVDKVNSSELVPCFNQVLLTKLGIALEKSRLATARRRMRLNVPRSAVGCWPPTSCSILAPWH